MIRFHQIFGAHTGRSLNFESNRITFGRMPDCDVAFDPHADIDASGNHAEVRLEPAGYVLLDLRSRNGTYLNGQRVDRALLANGDEIEFGPGGPRIRVDMARSVATGPMTPAQQSLAQQMAAGAPSAGGYAPNPPDPLSQVAPPSAKTGLATPVEGPYGAPPSAPPPAPSAPPPAPSAPPPAPSSPPDPRGGAKYGNKTVAMMIQSAVAQSQQQDSGRSTTFLRAVAQEAATNSSRGLKIAMALLSLMFMGALLLIGVLLLLYWRESDENRRETERLSEQVENQAPAGERIAGTYRSAIYMLVEQQGGTERGICTAFAIRPSVLGTNAHCVAAIEEGRARGAVFLAVQNEAPQSRIIVGEVIRHPSYTAGSPNPSADVGLVRIAGQAQNLVRLSSAQVDLRTGENIFVYGFPGNLADVSSPVATITDGVVGRMTRFDGTGGDDLSNQLIQHSAFTSPGTSGSPIFNQEGEVVAVNAGSFRAAARQDVLGNGQPAQQTVVTETGYKFGIRVDVLNGLLASVPQ